METELYFLRSSEQRIVTDTARHALRLETAEQASLADPFTALYGLSDRDLGLYALQGHTVAGAAWMRRFDEKVVNGFIDRQTPVMCVGLKPDFRGKGIGAMIVRQLLQEASVLYERVSLSVIEESDAVRFFESMGFTRIDGVLETSPLDGKPAIVMAASLKAITLERPKETYDPSRWMD
jgi:GNAT superfamily N-acetyltransferase